MEREKRTKRPKQQQCIFDTQHCVLFAILAKMLKMLVADEDNYYCQSDDGIFEKYVEDGT